MRTEPWPVVSIQVPPRTTRLRPQERYEKVMGPPPAFVLAAMSRDRAARILDWIDDQNRLRQQTAMLSGLLFSENPDRTWAYTRAAFDGALDCVREAHETHGPQLVDVGVGEPPYGFDHVRIDLPATLEVRRDGLIWRLSNARNGEYYETRLMKPALFVRALLATCEAEEVPAAFARLVELDPLRALDVLESGLSVMGASHARDISMHLVPRDVVALLKHEDRTVRERIATNIGRIRLRGFR